MGPVLFYFIFLSRSILFLFRVLYTTDFQTGFTSLNKIVHRSNIVETPKPALVTTRVGNEVIDIVH
jgi:hypothetical protein